MRRFTGDMMLTIRELAVLMLQDAARLTERAAQLITAAEPDEMTGAAPAPDDRLISAKEAARMIGIGESTLYRTADTFPFTRRSPSGRPRFSLLGVRAWIAGHRPGEPSRPRVA